jgi:hypothetical protein
MHASLILAISLAGAITLSGATGGQACAGQSRSACDAAAVAEFTAGVQEYLHLRDTAAGPIPPERLFEDPTEMLVEREALRQAIRDARPDARAGDLFTPRAAATIRRIVAETAAAQNVDPADIVRDLRAERMHGAKRPVVNGGYDWRLGAWMWSALLQTLPPLPGDLQYRIVSDDLVLIDVRASLVVDILEHAMVGDGD